MTPMNSHEVNSRSDLVQFLDALALEAQQTSGDWENPTVPRYISAASRWVEDMHGWYANDSRDAQEPTWEMIAAIFAAAAVYE